MLFKHLDEEFFWDMPDGFSIPSDPVLSLAEFVLLRPFGLEVDVLKKDADNGYKTALAFSGGVDSAAAYKLLDNPLPIYTQVANPSKLHKQENALLALDEVDGVSVLTNQDQLPLLYGKNRGFYGVAGWTVPSLLLSEYYNLNTFADGNILEFVYLRSKFGHGTKYVEPNYSEIINAFNKLNYHYCLPCAGLTEVATTKIAQDFKYAMGCMRGTDGKPCLNCMKCYRKMAIQGNCIKSNPEVEKVLEKEWIPVLASLLWARDEKGLRHPILNSIEKNYSWVEKWFPDSMEFIPLHLQSMFEQKLAAYNIGHLSDKSLIYNWSSYVSN